MDEELVTVKPPNQQRFAKVKKTLTRLLVDNRVRKISRFASSLLEVVSLIDTKNPLSIVSGSVSLIDAGVDAFELPYPNKFEQYAKTDNMIMRTDNLIRIIMSSGIAERVEPTLIAYDDDSIIKRMDFPFGTILFAENLKSAPVSDPQEKIWMVYYCSKDFDFAKLFDMIWERYDQGMYISVDPKRETVSSNAIKLHNLEVPAMCYIGSSPSLDEFKQEILLYRERKISRSYMMIGEPGTGKTTFSLMCARDIGFSRILKVDPSVLETMTSAKIEELVKYVRPEFVLLDDFDRVGGKSSKALLFILEIIKQHFPEIILITTVNDFNSLDSAIKRPGRIDKRIWFNMPSSEDRAKIIRYYVDDMKVDISDERLTQLTADTQDMSPAYIKEFCIRVSVEGWSKYDSILEEFKRTLESIAESDEEDSDSSGPDSDVLDDDDDFKYMRTQSLHEVEDD